ncbi:hypothetical protein DLM78_17150 [Leptospira stimsonii]|uniref:Uncharacterized protein n=1 Tax=Leptospira stimsonii TaxID=2202203 RepID=A0A8B3CQ45_9LEPT|nr:hypothetical protein DLM78_17150 [Leptospira stimsonii]
MSTVLKHKIELPSDRTLETITTRDDLRRSLGSAEQNVFGKDRGFPLRKIVRSKPNGVDGMKDRSSSRDRNNISFDLVFTRPSFSFVNSDEKESV